MANINATARRIFENAGVLTITISASAYIVLQIVPGSVKFRPGMARRVPQVDRGVISTPMEADAQPSEVEFQVYATVYTTSEIYSKIVAAAGSNGLAFIVDSIEVKTPANRLASTGDKATFANAWLNEMPEFQTGADGDTWSFKFQCPLAPTLAAY